MTPDQITSAINRVEYVNHSDLQALIGAVERLVHRQDWAFMGEVQDHLTDAFSAMDDVYAHEAEPPQLFTQADADAICERAGMPVLSVRGAA